MRSKPTEDIFAKHQTVRIPDVVKTACGTISLLLAMVKYQLIEDMTRRLENTGNATGVFLCIKHAVPATIGNGGASIANLSSIAGIIGGEGMHLACNASKAAARLLTKSTALQHGVDNIRANSA